MDGLSLLVSVVILAWNRREDLRESLVRLRENRYPNLEIIVCDNGSTDGTAQMVRAEFPHVTLIEIGRNIGIEAYNEGFRRARGKYIVILDDDSFPEAEAIGRMVERFEEDAELGIAAFDVRSYANYDRMTEGAAAGAPNNLPKYLMGFNGAGAGVRKAVFDSVGYYPGEFFLYWNEQDLALRTLSAGWKIRFFPDIVSYHKHSPANRESWRAPYYYCRNSFWLVWKNYPLRQAVGLTLKLCRLIVQHSMEQRTIIYLRAMFAAIRCPRSIILSRKPVPDQIALQFRAPIELSFTFFK
jgi:GT2 family glycosyltransferase